MKYFFKFLCWLAFALSPFTPYVWFISLTAPRLEQAVLAVLGTLLILHVVAGVMVSHYRARRAMLYGAGAWA